MRTAAREEKPHRRQHRKKAAAVSVAVSVLLLVTVIAVPTTRTALVDVWCDVTDSACVPGPGLPGLSVDSDDWRVRLSPVASATWGHYVALGDSYTSGDGAGDYLDGTTGDDGCYRSPNAYPALTSEEFDFAGGFGFEACSKEKASGLLETAGEEDSQLGGLTEYTSLVSIGIGGNDLGFTPVLQTCLVRLPLVSSGVCTAQEDEIEKRMRHIDTSVDGVLEEIRDRAPDARVLMVGYPRLFPTEPAGMYYTLTDEDQIWLNAAIDRFNDRLRDTAAEADRRIAEDGDTGSVEFVDVYDALEGHEVSVEEGSWLNGVVIRSLAEGIDVDRSSFHPTAEGQAAFAERVQDQVSSGPDRDLYADRDRVLGAHPDVLARDLE